MIRRLRWGVVNWSGFGNIPDIPDYGVNDRGEAAMEYDDYRRRVTQEAATLARIEENRRRNREKKAEPRQAVAPTA